MTLTADTMFPQRLPRAFGYEELRVRDTMRQWNSVPPILEQGYHSPQRETLCPYGNAIPVLILHSHERYKGSSQPGSNVDSYIIHQLYQSINKPTHRLASQCKACTQISQHLHPTFEFAQKWQVRRRARSSIGPVVRASRSRLAKWVPFLPWMKAHLLTTSQSATK